MLPTRFTFIDVETTGMNPSKDRIIEIGIIRVENNKIVKTFNSLINPEVHIPPEIERITGISSKDVMHAPLFNSVKNEVRDLLNDSYFVAHNARFDYGFIKYEFKRSEISFSSKHLCTVKLSRNLFPEHRRHDLTSIIERFNIPCKNRHRAYDDAMVLWEYFKIINTQFSQEIIEKAFSAITKRPSLPIHLSQIEFKTLPEGPGVYIFFGENNIPLYIGKSVNLKERILSHFSSDFHIPVDMKISQQIQRIETIVTAGELGAFLKESSLIKKLQPLYNRKLRNSKSLVIIKRVLNSSGYFIARIETVSEIDINDLSEIIGVFKSKREAKQFITDLGREFHLCNKLNGLEKTNSSCFYYRLNWCKGACIEKEKKEEYNARFIIAFSNNKIKPWPFNGPIAIEEEYSLDGKKQSLLFNNWCYLGSYIDNQHSDSFFDSQESTFDIDTYKILNSFFKSSRNIKVVKTISSEVLQKLQIS